MIQKISKARYVRDYILWLEFDDGVSGEVDLKEDLWGEMFDPLKNPEVFKRFMVHPELHTVVWENGADFAPEFLRSKLLVYQKN